MRFQNFKRFNFMFQRGKTPLRITVEDKDAQPKQDDQGNLVYPSSTKEVEEPLLPQSVPVTTYDGNSGGVVETTVMIWVSHTAGYPKDTIVEDIKGRRRYRVTQSTPDRMAGLTYYQLKDSNDDNQWGGESRVRTDSGSVDQGDSQV